MQQGEHNKALGIACNLLCKTLMAQVFFTCAIGVEEGVEYTQFELDMLPVDE